MTTFNDIQNLLKSDLQKTDQVLLTKLHSEVELINQMSDYIINAGGKRLRPLLLLLAAKATNYQGDFHHLMAVVIELIHTATLLHDDIVDESTTRRGIETAHEIWGNAASVLVGDFLYSRAFEMMLAPKSMRIMQILSKTTNNIAEGEVLQLLNCRNATLSQTQYFAVIEQKTACLFQAATQIGAILSNVTSAQESALTTYGLYLGKAFQMVDDILDYQSDAKTIGKTVGNDLAEGKTTLPMIYALKNTDKEKHKLLQNSIKNADNANIKAVIDILTEVKAFDYAYKKAQECADYAKKSLSVIEDSDYKTALILLCDLSLQRQS